MRIGQGFDVHAFAPEGRSLVIGGVTISHDRGLSGHSDADVLSHAVADALLGAARLGDLGSNFPGDDRWKDSSSLSILEETARMIGAAGYVIANVDASVIAETPRMAPYRDEMASNIAAALGIDEHLVSVKATTTDGLGAIGRGEGIAALAVVLLNNSA